jgi:hypothetical protein
MGDEMAISGIHCRPRICILGSLTLSGQCLKGVYPFHDGKIEDFEPVFDYLIKVRTCSVLIRRSGSDKSAERYQRRL